MTEWNEKLKEVQEIIQKNGWDGWLLYDFRKSNELACEVRNKYGTTILMVTHDFRDAISLSDKIFLLQNGEISQEWKLTKSLHNDPQAFHQLNEQLLTSIKSRT